MRFFKNLRNTGFGIGIIIFYLSAFIGFLNWARYWLSVADIQACMHWMCFGIGGMIFGLGLIIIYNRIFENVRIIKRIKNIRRVKTRREKKREEKQNGH